MSFQTKFLPFSFLYGGNSRFFRLPKFEANLQNFLENNSNGSVALRKVLVVVLDSLLLLKSISRIEINGLFVVDWGVEVDAVEVLHILLGALDSLLEKSAGDSESSVLGEKAQDDQVKALLVFELALLSSRPDSAGDGSDGYVVDQGYKMKLTKLFF